MNDKSRSGFNTEKERLEYAKEEARKRVAAMDPQTVQKFGEMNLEMDLTSEILLELPPAKRWD